MEIEGKKEQPKLNKYALGCAIVASLISIIFGYDTGVMSGASIFIKEDLKLNDTQIEILAGILNVCALVGSLLSGKTSDMIGRRYTIVVASLIFFVGAILMGYSPNFAILMTGRCIAGLGVGFALMIAPVYSAEISSSSHRGALTSLPELCITLGILIGYISNYAFAKLPLKLGWRMMLGVAAIPSIGLAFGILKLPESPRWLVLQGRLKDAKEVLFVVCDSKEEAQSRFIDIKVAAGLSENCDEDVVIPSQKAATGAGVWKELLIRPTPTVRRIFIAACGIHFFQHLTGIEAVILYSPRIFKKAGVVGKQKLLLATIGVGITKAIFILTATCYLDRFGRRKLLLISVGGVITSLSILGFCLTMVDHSKKELLWALSLSIISTYIYVAFFSIGLGPITWVYTSEIFPLRLRAQGACIGVAINRGMNAAISMSFISIYKAITIGGAFFMFAGFSTLAGLFFFFFLPETKGKALEEIEMLFTKGSDVQPRTEVVTV
ncbi:probable polyol transporter 6 isoform X3 [Telopea speciosissima]|uniref:probable polyol transporter 6 isoform X3 n=1 Tax=Telopea speciosissima TaxID=54955 RepID=UPI001CC47D3D|nr:probable polyol transporter 6 isoform X3 [Telopea speciosissima]